MGRKVNPIGFRLGVNKTWDGRWYAEGSDYTDQLHQDFEIRDQIKELAPRAGVSKIEIERYPGNVRIFVHTAKPGVLIGRKGESVKIMRKALETLVGKKVDLQIKEIKSPDLDAYLREAFITRGMEWEEEKIGDFQIFYQLSEQIHVEQTGLGMTTEP